MNTNRFAAALLSTSLIVTGTGQAMADAGDIAGGIIGGIIGGAIVNEAQKNRQRTTVVRKTYVKPRSTVNTAARAENREIQTALNYFGFPAGTPDGIIGRNSRRAISSYQAHLGYPVTGQLTTYEKDFLVGSYHRALAGGAITHQQIAANPAGPKGLLQQYRDEAAGIRTVAPAPVPAVPQAPATTTVAVPSPAPAAPEPATPNTEVMAAKEVPLGDSGALPTFLGGGEARSLASHCNTVSLLTNTNGGFTTLANMTDGGSVLNEQFCLARTYAIAQGEELAGAIKGVTADEIAKQCQSFGPVMKDHVAALSLEPSESVLREVSGFVLQSGMAPQQLAGTAKICLSVGYRTDDMDVAIGSALLLAALGEKTYGELMGHHLSQGFGATERTDLASDWYLMAIDALKGGAPAVFAPGQPERVALIEAAAMGSGGEAGTMTAPVQPASALPTFNVEQ